MSWYLTVFMYSWVLRNHKIWARYNNFEWISRWGSVVKCDFETYFGKKVLFWRCFFNFDPRFEEVILVGKIFNLNFRVKRVRNTLEKWSYYFSHQNLIFPTRLKKNLGSMVWILIHFPVNGLLNEFRSAVHFASFYWKIPNQSPCALVISPEIALAEI